MPNARKTDQEHRMLTPIENSPEDPNLGENPAARLIIRVAITTTCTQLPGALKYLHLLSNEPVRRVNDNM